MASSVGACNASAQMLIKHAQEGNIRDVLDKETIDALVNVFAPLKNAKKRTLKKSTERADIPFNKKCCAARQFVLACHPCDEEGKSTPLYRNIKSEGEEHHYGLLNVQCSKSSINSDGLCSHHADTSKKSTDAGRCHETKKLFLGLYSDPDKPENPIRISTSNTKHYYHWIENVPEDIQQKQTSKKKSNTKKSRSNQHSYTEKYEDRNWLADLNTSDIDEFNLNRLKLYSKHHNLPTHSDPDENGKKKALSKALLLVAIKQHIKQNAQENEQADRDDAEQQDDGEDQQQNVPDIPPPPPAEDTPAQHVEQVDEVEHVEEDEELTQQDNATLTWTTPDGVTYDLELGELYDQENGEKVGELSDTATKGWIIRKEAIMIHAANIAKKMEDAM